MTFLGFLLLLKVVTFDLLRSYRSQHKSQEENHPTFWKFFTLLCIKYHSVAPYRLIVGTLFHIFTMSAIKWHVRFVDCSLIYANFQRLFVFKTFEFGANFGPRWFSLGFEFETIYGKICKIQQKISCHILAELEK